MIVVLYELLSHLTVRTGNNWSPESGPVTKNETKNLNIRRSTRDYRHTEVFNSINFVTTLLQLCNRTQLIYHGVSHSDIISSTCSSTSKCLAQSVVKHVRGLQLCHETTFIEFRGIHPGKSEENNSQFPPYSPASQASCASLVSAWRQ